MRFTAICQGDATGVGYNAGFNNVSGALTAVGYSAASQNTPAIPQLLAILLDTRTRQEIWLRWGLALVMG